MSGGHDTHGHDDHAPKSSSGGGPSHSVIKGAATNITGMFEFAITGIFGNEGGSHHAAPH